MDYKLLGFYEGTTKKDNRPFCVVHLGHNASVVDNNRGNYGMVIDNYYLPDNMVGTLSVADCGKDVDVEFSISGRYVNIANIKVIK